MYIALIVLMIYIHIVLDKYHEVSKIPMFKNQLFFLFFVFVLFFVVCSVLLFVVGCGEGGGAAGPLPIQFPMMTV